MGTIAQLFETGEQTAQKGHFRNLVLLARIDGKIETSERKLLTKIANRLALTDEQVKEILDNPESYPVIPPYSKEERLERFVQLLEMSTADGDSSGLEKGLIEKFFVALGFEDENFESMYETVVSKITEGKSKDTIVEELM
jgi:uncharacterized tellurite resistance protein B-like protein